MFYRHTLPAEIDAILRRPGSFPELSPDEIALCRAWLESARPPSSLAGLPIVGPRSATPSEFAVARWQHDVALFDRDVGRLWTIVAFNETRQTAPPVPPPGADANGNIHCEIYLPAREIAQLFSLPQDALEKRLQRYRRTNHNGWNQMSDPRSHEARYLYQLSAVRPIVDDMKRPRKTSPKRPSKKNPPS